MPRHLNKTAIEWCDYTWNPITGCLYGCEYCYARRWARWRGKLFSGRQFIPKYHPDRVTAPLKYRKPSTIFVCSMGEMFAPWVYPAWVAEILRTIHAADHHTFVALTKQPQLVQYPLPKNLWLGTSVDQWYNVCRLEYLARTKAAVKIACFEPLLSDMIHLQRAEHLAHVDWVIIGGCTGWGKAVAHPQPEWIDRIRAEASGIPVFIKSNAGYREVVRQWPERGIRRL
jgi:protein gp37